MSFMSLFKKKTNTAATAKERLQIVIAHERTKRSAPDFLPELEKEILEVIRKYVDVAPADVNVKLEREDDCAVLELNISLPDD